MRNRRDFIKKASLWFAGGIMAPKLLASCELRKYLGLQLYSLRDMVGDEGIRKTLEVVANMGYTHLETADYRNGKFYGENPADLKKMVEELGMQLTSSHLSRNITEDRNADMAWWNTAVEAHSEAGMKYMVVPSSPLRGENATFDNVKRYCDYFNDIALLTAGSNMQFGYHNHAFEFENKVNGVPVFDMMLEQTNPAHVTFQLDVYWIKMGGYDPVEYMKKYANRFKLLHIKDETAIGAQKTVDYKAVFDTAYAIGVKDWFVEVERYDETPQEDVQKSADFLLNADFVK